MGGAGGRQQRGASSKARNGSGAGVWGKAWGLSGLRGPPPARPPLTHSGLRGGGAVCRPRGGFSVQGGRGRGAEIAFSFFPGAAGPGADVSFSSLTVGGRRRGVWAMTLNNNSAFWRSGLAAGGRRAGGPAGGDGAGMADRRVVRAAGRRTVPAVAGGRSCPSAPRRPSR